MTFPKDCSSLILPTETERLRLEPLTLDHLETSYVLCSDPEVCRYIRPAITREAVVERIKSCSRPWVFENKTWCSFAVIIKAENKMIGEVVFRAESTEESCGEIGFRFLPEASGKGYAFEAAKAVADFMFDQLKLHRLVAYCQTDNRGSYRLLEKLGMQREGCLRGAGLNGTRWCDLYVYGRLENDPV